MGNEALIGVLGLVVTLLLVLVGLLNFSSSASSFGLPRNKSILLCGNSRSLRSNLIST
jgi:hypothetical protein